MWRTLRAGAAFAVVLTACLAFGPGCSSGERAGDTGGRRNGYGESFQDAARRVYGNRLKTADVVSVTGGVLGKVLLIKGPYHTVDSYRMLDAMASGTTAPQVIMFRVMLPASDGTGEYHSYEWNSSAETRTVSWGELGGHSIMAWWGRAVRPSFDEQAGSGLAGRAQSIDAQYVARIAAGELPPPAETKPVAAGP